MESGSLPFYSLPKGMRISPKPCGLNRNPQNLKPLKPYALNPNCHKGTLIAAADFASCGLELFAPSFRDIKARSSPSNSLPESLGAGV